MEEVVELPNDVWWLIFSKIRLKERPSLALVSRSCYQIFIESTTELDEFDVVLDGGKFNNFFLSQFTNLRNLELFCQGEITEDGIRKLTKLERLSLSSDIYISNDIFRNLVNLKHLVIYDNYAISSECLEGMTQLQSLSLLQNCHIDGRCLNNHLTNLTSLDLRQSAAVIRISLEFFTRLETLKISDECSNSFSRGTRLIASFHRRGFSSSINDKKLRNLTNLKNLDINGDTTKLLSNDGFLTLTNLQALKISPENSIDFDLLKKQLTNLTELKYYPAIYNNFKESYTD